MNVKEDLKFCKKKVQGVGFGSGGGGGSGFGGLDG